MGGLLAFNKFFISFGFQREVEARLQTQEPIPEGLISKLYVKFKKMFTPPGVATRNEWGPILFKYCPVQYDGETRHLKIKDGEFVGKRKTNRDISLIVDSECEDNAFKNDDDDDEIHTDIDDVDNDDGQVPVVVVADDIFPGLYFLF